MGTVPHFCDDVLPGFAFSDHDDLEAGTAVSFQDGWSEENLFVEVGQVLPRDVQI